MKAPCLFSLVTGDTEAVQGFVKLTWREAVEKKVNVARLNRESFEAIASATVMDLEYFANSDEERYSIQQHEEMLRNLVVQLTEYPVYVSSPLHVQYGV